MQWFRIGVALLVSGQAMVFSLAVNISPPTGSVRLIIHGILALSALVVILVAGLPIIRLSFTALFKKKIVVEQLFLLGIIGAFCGSLQSTLTGVGGIYYEVVAILVAIYSFNTLLSEGRRQKSISSARAFRAQFAQCRVVTCCGSIKEKPVKEVEIGDKIRVSMGEGIPVDGVVREGIAFVQETGMTGEPYPVVKREGDAVLAGTICVDNSLTIEATKDGSHRELDSLLKIVEEARFKPSGIQSMADRMVSWFLPVVTACSIVAFAGWTFLGQWEVGLFNAMAVLIVACPCAMGLATPIGLWSAIAALAKRGLILHTGEFIERIAAIDTVVFDKTGTLSDEKLQVEEVIVDDGLDREEVLGLIHFVESHSNHPIAKAFQSLVTTLDTSGFRLLKMDALPGQGIEASIEDSAGRGVSLVIGNNNLLHTDQKPAADLLTQKRYSSTESPLVLNVLINQKLVSLIYLREAARNESKEVTGYLHRAGIRTVIMSGDKEENVRKLSLGADEIQGGLTPQEKADRIKALQDSGKKVLFVGDGANDAPALSIAYSSIAMGSGTSLAHESAQATLFGGNLLHVIDAICLSRLVIRRIRSNILFAFFYNIIGISLAMLGLIHPVLAAILMLISSATVSWRAFRLGEKIQEGDLGRFRNLLSQTDTIPFESEGLVPLIKEMVFREKTASVLALCVALQGPFLSYLARLDFQSGVLVTFVFVLIAIVGFIFCIRPGATYTLRACYGMLALGNLAMIAGWWADAGFGAIVRDGICLCACEKSILGKGLLSHINLMHIGMIAGGIPGMAYGNSILPKAYESVFIKYAHLLTCLVGMYIGMMLGALVMAQFKVGDPHLYVVCSFFAMTIGMLLGMILVCVTWFKLNKD
ncbi:MAG: cation-translocating P-type ATPase [Verrucomicrobiota bacterium]|nr:cation-translocating P-type ATPase [Verrucomicrobiota bacterium]